MPQPLGMYGDGAATGVTSDQAGNFYISGSASGQLPDATLPGARGAFVRKYDPSGNILWTNEFTSNPFSGVSAITADHLGGLYMTGGVTVDSFYNGQSFVWKMDASGNMVWSTQFGGLNTSTLSAISIDPSRNVIIGGFAAPVQFSRDALVAKFDADGKFLWKTDLGFTGNGSTTAVAANSLGDIFVTGSSGTNPYFAELDPQGNTLFSKVAPNLGVDGRKVFTGLAVDSSDNIYLSGTTNTTIEATNENPTAIGPSMAQAFLTKFDSAGNLLWTQLFRNTGVDFGSAVAIDAAGDPYLTGFLNDNGGNSADNDLFVAKFDTAGHLLWSDRRGSPSDDRSRSVSIDPLGGVVIVGETEGGLNGGHIPTTNAFLIKFAPVPEPTSLLLAFAACFCFSLSRRSKCDMHRRTSL